MLGLGLLGWAGLLLWQDRQEADRVSSAVETYRRAGTLWDRAPVDALFPPVLDGAGAGPGGADRKWTRIAVSPRTECAEGLSKEWQKEMEHTGCTRVLRATYTDATRSSLVSAGLVFTTAGPEAMDELRGQLSAPAALGIGGGQRAAYKVSVRSDAPVVVYTVSAFADKRDVPQARPAEDAMKPADRSAVALAGLGHAAESVADGLEAALAAQVAPPAPEARS
ncbi:hypothetical protein [Streptomyces sp. NPDC089799]|uniref:hypothetical protein n=1 Tax=Streptomyces sp. NPDC089799 TaxID=3155066 RepID=UPI0034361AE3